MAWFQVERRHVLIVFELTAFDQDFLAFGGDAGEGEDLEFEGGARFCRVDFDIEFLALPFHNNYSQQWKTWGYLE